MAAIGRYSYSLYLWHIVPLLLLAEATSVPKPVLGVLAAAATVALTMISYRYLERPFLRARSDVLRPQPRQGIPHRVRSTPRSASAVTRS